MKKKNHYSFDYWCRVLKVSQLCSQLDWAFYYGCESGATKHPSFSSSLSFVILGQHSEFSMTSYKAISILIDPDFAFALWASSSQRCSTSLHRLKLYCSFSGFSISVSNRPLRTPSCFRGCLAGHAFDWIDLSGNRVDTRAQAFHAVENNNQSLRWQKG